MKAALEKILGTLSAAVVCAAVLAGAVQAAERPDDRGGMLGVGAAQVATAPDAVERAVIREHAETAARPDDRGGLLGVGAAQVLIAPDVFERAVLREQAATVRPDDRAETRGPGPSRTAQTSVAAFGDGGFAWGDAAFGAGATLGLALLGAVILGVRRRGRVAPR